MTDAAKTVVITGAAGLIGSAFSKAVVEAGYQLVIADANVEAAERLCSELREQGGEACVQPFDATDPASIQQLLINSIEHYGSVDALVNNLYIRKGNYGADFFDVSYADFCANLSANTGAMFECSKVFGRYFCDRNQGNIISIASVYGCIAPRFEVYDGTPMTMPVEYAAIKSAVLHLTRFMAKRFKGHKVRVNAISPGGILDGQPEPFLAAYGQFCANKGMLDKEDLSGALLFLLSDQSAFMTGQNLVIDDGFTL